MSISLLSMDTSASMEFYVKDNNKITREEANDLSELIHEYLRIFLAKKNKDNLFSGEYYIDISISASEILLNVNIHRKWGPIHLIKNLFFFPTRGLGSLRKITPEEVEGGVWSMIELYLKSKTRKKIINGEKFAKIEELMVSLLREDLA